MSNDEKATINVHLGSVMLPAPFNFIKNEISFYEKNNPGLDLYLSISNNSDIITFVGLRKETDEEYEDRIEQEEATRKKEEERRKESRKYADAISAIMKFVDKEMKMNAIKEARQHFGMSLLQAKLMVEEMIEMKKKEKNNNENV